MLVPSIQGFTGVRMLASATFLILILLTGCAANEPLIPPAELQSISTTTPIRASWTHGVGARDKRGVSSFTPVLDSGIVYAASVDGAVHAVMALTGKIQWRKNLDRALQSGLSTDSDQVYLADAEGQVIALDKATGDIRWEYTMSSEVNAPVAAGSDSVIVRGADGRLVALNANDGVERWSKTYTPPALTVHGYGRPLLVSGGVLVGLDDGALVALDLDSGKTLWQSELSYAKGRSEIERLVDIDAEPLIDASYIYAVNFQGKLARLEPGQGRQVWSVPMSSVVGMAQSDSALYVVDTSDHLIAVSKESGQELWRNEQLEGRLLTRPVLVNGLLVVADFEGYVHVLAAADGVQQARSRAGSKPVRVVPLVQDDTVILFTTDAKLRSFRLGSS